MASDDLDAPLGKKPKRKALTLPVTPPQIVAGLLGTTVVIVALWTAIADDPYGGEPIAVVATRLTTANAKDHDIAAAAGKPGEKITPAATAAPAASAEKAPPPGSKVVTITDGSTGKAQQVVVPPRAGDKLAAMAADPRLLEDSRHGQIPKIASDGKRASMAYAKPVNAATKSDAPKIAIVVGGLGVSSSVTEDALTKLPGPVTLAFVPYGGELDNLSARARAADHEVLLQAPMEPFDYPDNDPGPQTLLTTLSLRIWAFALRRAVSIGSKATTEAPRSSSMLAMSSDGAARRSSVLGLNVSPRSATRRPATPSTKASMRSTNVRRWRRLMSSTAAKSGVSWPRAAASRTVIVTWCGRQEPPNPIPARRNEPPIRGS